MKALFDSGDETAGEGQPVIWDGVVRNVFPEKNRLVVKRGGYTFVAEFALKDVSTFVPGDVVKIQGTILKRSTFGAYHLRGVQVWVTKANKEARARRRRQDAAAGTDRRQGLYYFGY